MEKPVVAIIGQGLGHPVAKADVVFMFAIFGSALTRYQGKFWKFGSKAAVREAIPEPNASSVASRGILPPLALVHMSFDLIAADQAIVSQIARGLAEAIQCGLSVRLSPHTFT